MTPRAIRACNRNGAKTEAEIERAHDLILTAIEIFKEQLADEEKTRIVMGVAIDVLCWILNHKQDTQMENLIQSLEELLDIRRIDAEELHRQFRSALTN